MEILNLNGFTVEIHWVVAAPLVAALWSSWIGVLASVAKKSRELGEDK